MSSFSWRFSSDSIQWEAYAKASNRAHPNNDCVHFFQILNKLWLTSLRLSITNVHTSIEQEYGWDEAVQSHIALYKSTASNAMDANSLELEEFHFRLCLNSKLLNTRQNMERKQGQNQSPNLMKEEERSRQQCDLITVLIKWYKLIKLIF